MKRPGQNVVCGAKTRQGTPCRRYAVPGRTRCRLHGGLTPVGMGSPNYKHGRFSKYLPQHLGDIAFKAETDPDLLNLRSLIGVYEARLAHLFGLVGSGASAERFSEIKKTWGQFRMAQQMGNNPTAKAKMIEAAYKMDELIEGIDHDYMLWRDIDVAAKNFKLLNESEWKRAVALGRLMPVAKVSGFAREILVIVRSEVTDSKVWGRVQDRVAELLGGYPDVVQADDEQVTDVTAIEGEFEINDK